MEIELGSIVRVNMDGQNLEELHCLTGISEGILQKMHGNYGIVERIQPTSSIGYCVIVRTGDRVEDWWLPKQVLVPTFK